MLVRWWWLILLLTFVAAAVGFAVSLRLDPVYRASASVIVGQSIQATSLDSRDIQTSERLALSYADIARRQPILEAANVSLNLGYPWQDLRKRVRVELVPDTQLIEIAVEAGSRDEAIEIADEIARQLILLSPTSLPNQQDENTTLFVHTRLQALQNKIQANQEKLDVLSSELLEAPTFEQKAELQAEINNLESMIVDWEDNYAKFLAYAGSEESANYLAIVETAHGRVTPIRPVIRLNTIIAGAVGLVLALGLVLLLDFLDDTLKKPDDISQDLNLVPLGSIGQFGGRDPQKRKIIANDPFSPLTESYRMIRNNLQFMSLDKPGRSILVTSPASDDGKSVTAVNLGIVMALNGQRTIVVEADLRKPTLHKIFQVPNGKGLTNHLRDSELETNIPLIDTEVKGLRLLTAGDLPPNPSELLGSQRMEQLIASLMDEADVLIFDSPPVAYIADAAVLSKYVDGVVLVVSSGRTRRDVTKQAVFNLQQAGANILGVVLNRTADKNGRYKYKHASTNERLEPTVTRTLAGLQQAWNTLTLPHWWKRWYERYSDKRF
jgi:non-specific protein-tyrosine kinase